MQPEIRQLFLSENGLDAQGREYLACERGLSIPCARQAGIASRDGKIYFAYKLNGEIVRWKYRSMTDKKDTRFSTLSEDEKGSFKMPFYNQQVWPRSDFLIVTEGEFDCIALLQLVGSNVVSLPNGAASLESTFRNQYEYLQNFDKIYICTDMDDAGELAAKKAMAMISPSKYRRLVLPCKDANEWLMRNPNLEMKDLELLMLNARCVEDRSFTDMYSLEDEVYDPIELGASSGWKSLDAALGGVRKGEVTVISADTGSGKSTFCMNLIYNLAVQKHAVWVNSYEMHYKIVTRKLASVVLKRKMKFEAFDALQKFNYMDWLSKHRCYINRSTAKVDLPTLRKQFEAASLAYGIDYIILDHLDYIHSAGKKATALENIDDAVREIHSLAMEFNVGVILVAHPKQLQSPSQEITMADLKGSSAIKQYADNIIVLTRMDRIDPNDLNRVKVRVWKNRLVGIEKQIFLRYLADIDGYVEGV